MRYRLDSWPVSVTYSFCDSESPWPVTAKLETCLCEAPAEVQPSPTTLSSSFRLSRVPMAGSSFWPLP